MVESVFYPIIQQIIVNWSLQLVKSVDRPTLLYYTERRNQTNFIGQYCTVLNDVIFEQNFCQKLSVRLRECNWKEKFVARKLIAFLNLADVGTLFVLIHSFFVFVTKTFGEKRKCLTFSGYLPFSTCNGCNKFFFSFRLQRKTFTCKLQLT